MIDDHAPCRCTHPKLTHNAEGQCPCGCPEFRKLEIPKGRT